MPQLPQIKARPRYKTPNRQVRREFATYSKQWRRIRLNQLARQPFCKCGQWANEVDHINNNARDNTQQNLQSMCKPCHSRKTAIEMGLNTGRAG